MLEGILLSIVLAFVGGYIAIAIFSRLFDRPKSEEWHQRRIQALQRACIFAVARESGILDALLRFLPMGMSIDETKRILAKR